MRTCLVLAACVGVSLGAVPPIQRSLQADEPKTSTAKANQDLNWKRLGDLWVNPCGQGMPLQHTDACDQSLSIDLRVEALVNMIPTSDKARLLGNGAASVSALGIPAYQWWSEALHGVGNSPGVSFSAPTTNATSFPQVITTSASFNTTLFRLIGEAVGTEARAFHNLGHGGGTYWAPNVNIFRDPRWGRGQETPGEDPTLSADYAGNFPLGMQSGESYPQYLKVSSCCKHFVAYSLENWHGIDRHHFNAIVSKQDLADTYLPAFQSCVQRSNASGFMCSYNSVNGIPSCASSDLLTSTLREQWGFDGYVTSDCGAVYDVMATHLYTNTTDSTCLATLSAGMDIDCGDFIQGNLDKCMNDTTCSSAVVNPALAHLFRVQMRLGLYDDEANQPYSKLGVNDISTDQHKQLALEAARQGMVLLKNEKRLPVEDIGGMNVAFLGPLFDARGTMLGNYYGNPPYIISPLDAIKAAGVNVVTAQGCNVLCNDTSGFAAATKLASETDLSVLFVGLDQSQESEGLDRTSITLPNFQQELISQVCGAAKAPIVLVVLSGGSVDLSFAKTASCVGAIIWAGYPGQSGGTAIADVLAGFYNPAGKLTQTFYPKDFVDQVPLTDMGMRPNSTSGNPGRTHRFYTGTPVYEFGSGISFSTFSYSIPQHQQQVSVSHRELMGKIGASAQNLATSLDAVTTLQVRVCNSEEMAGDHIVLVFAVPPAEARANPSTPRRTLAAYTRIHANAGECLENVTIDIPPRAFALYDDEGLVGTHKGQWSLVLGQPQQLAVLVDVV